MNWKKAIDEIDNNDYITIIVLSLLTIYVWFFVDYSGMSNVGVAKNRTLILRIAGPFATLLYLCRIARRIGMNNKPKNDNNS